MSRTVVVGAGSAGCVVAARLCEQSEVTLLEAGPDHGATPPPDLTDARRNSMRRHDWGLWHKPREGWVRLPYPRGRVVGGSSAVNTCITLRGEPEDFTEWGLPGWDWDACLAAFRRLERDLDFPDSPWHGAEGPLPIRRPRRDELVPWQAAFLAACDRLGLPKTDDHNRPGSTGAGPHAFNRLDGRRISAADAWLTDRVRARIRIRPDSHVIKVVLQGLRVVGVEVLQGRATAIIPTDRVVLCAGAVHTPGILLRSGVGPRATLERMGIDRRVELPVAARLLDHPGFALFLRPRGRHARVEHPIMQTCVRLRSEVGQAAGLVPNDLQVQPGSNTAFPWFNVPMISMMGHVGKPFGEGQISWTSASPLARPVITSRLMEDPRDRKIAAQGIRLAQALLRTPEMRDMHTPLWPNPALTDDADALDTWLRTATDSGYHPCGTAPMGVDDDPRAVCDPMGRLRGVEGLWLADASVMPTIPSSNIHLATLMIAERIATFLAGQRT